MRKHPRLWNTYRFSGFRPSPTIHGIFGDPKARVIRLHRRGKKRAATRAVAPIERATTASCAGYATCRAGTRGSTWSWRAFRNSTLKPEHAPQARILFDKFHVMRHLGEALDTARKREYARLTGTPRRFIKGQKYTLLSRRENLTTTGRRSLKTLLKTNKRLNTAFLFFA